MNFVDLGRLAKIYCPGGWALTQQGEGFQKLLGIKSKSFSLLIGFQVDELPELVYFGFPPAGTRRKRRWIILGSFLQSVAAETAYRYSQDIHTSLQQEMKTTRRKNRSQSHEAISHSSATALHNVTRKYQHVLIFKHKINLW